MAFAGSRRIVFTHLSTVAETTLPPYYFENTVLRFVNVRLRGL